MLFSCSGIPEPSVGGGGPIFSKDALTRAKDGTAHWGFRDSRTRKQHTNRPIGTSSKEVLHLEEQGGGGQVTEGHVREDWLLCEVLPTEGKYNALQCRG